MRVVNRGLAIFDFCFFRFSFPDYRTTRENDTMTEMTNSCGNVALKIARADHSRRAAANQSGQTSVQRASCRLSHA